MPLGLGSHRARQKGNVALLTAIMLIPIISVLGGAVDVVRAVQTRMELQKAVESAVLAAASLTNERDMEATVLDYFRANIAGTSISFDAVDLDITTVRDAQGKRVQVSAGITVTTYFLRLMNINEFPVQVVSGGRQDWQQVEISLVLDVSGSMRGSNKIADMRIAAEAFVDEVLTDEVRDITSISIIPFGTHVRVGDSFLPFVNPSTIDSNKDNNFSDGHRWRGCLDLPTTAYTAAPLTPNTLSPLPEFRDYRLCANANNEALYLSNNHTNLVNHIRGLEAESSLAGGTGIDEGATIGLLALASGMRGRFAGPFQADRPTDYGGDILKVIVIMTDGDMTKWYRPQSCWYYAYSCIHFPIQNSEAEASLIAMCEQATEDGVMVFTVGFAIAEGSRADTVLNDCAPSPGNYFLVDKTDIGQAFSAIAANINRVRIFL